MRRPSWDVGVMASCGVPSWHHGSLTRLAGAAAVAVWSWMERSRQRRALAQLDDHLLRDIGLTRDEARREWATPFWRA